MFGNNKENKDKNFDSILTHVKRIHALEHDATTAEIDAHLESCQTIEEIRAAASHEGEQAVGGQLISTNEELQARTTERDALQTQLTEAKAEATRLLAEAATLRTQAEQLQSDLDTANAEIARLEKLPAAEHTNGPTDDTKPTKSTMPVWEQVKKRIEKL